MSKKKTAPPPQEQPAHLEDSISNVTDRVSHALQKYLVPIIVASVALIAILALSAVFGWYRDANNLNQANEIWAAFAAETEDGVERSDDEIRASLDSIAPSLHGKTQEPHFAAKYASWLWDLEEEDAAKKRANREQALKVVDGALGRHSDNTQLQLLKTNYAKSLQLDAAFKVPDPPEPEPTVTPNPNIQIQPGANISPAPTTGTMDVQPGQPAAPTTGTPATGTPATGTPATQDPATQAPATQTPPAPTTQPAATTPPTTQPSGGGG